MQNIKKERETLSTDKLWSAVIGRKVTRPFRVLSFAENDSRILLLR